MDSQFTISYQIGDVLYLNLTNRCSNKCVFCIRESQAGVGYNLWLEKEPTVLEILDAVMEPAQYKEIVFCGYGEPLSRLDVVKEVASNLKGRGAKSIRINTNGKANIFYGRNIVPDVGGIIDTMSISLNAHNAVTYNELCNPVEGEEAYYAILDFARKCIGVIPKVILSVVEWPGVNIEACEKIALEIGADFRLRKPTL
ncbi:TatD family nuclease-associated radical SAM protein [Desulforamulus aquiferis]|uniref:TatD family nuclease-associated radical SAM protein n=1 Tax=Desulforamulus aquiferis TaxID=1397668 RepID=A0AAW7ZBH3_9FIRM|nr:TatD family nuclease-associated radical SAM protein [Desulforamulus aquiferis]MDO7786135.1 TatD family nuclease-associated radical SAM protein [Desulforamulus aquiferis]